MRVGLLSTLRTPFVKAGGAFSSFSTVDLGSHVVTELLRASDVAPLDVDEFFFGAVLPNSSIPQLAREIVLRSGLPKSLVAHSVSNNCITGLMALSVGCDAIASGRCQTIVAGGAESMSNPTLAFAEDARRLFLRGFRSKSSFDQLKIFAQLRPRHFSPQSPSPREPSTGLTMGEHCEIMAKEFGISREAQDAWAYESHRRAAVACQQERFSHQVVPFGGTHTDGLVRADTTVEKLASLPTVFDKSVSGSLTAGNSSALTDGASAFVLVSEERLKSIGRRPLAWVTAIEFAAVPPGDGLLMAPALAVPRLLRKAGRSAREIDLFEVHEAFAAQVLCNLAAWECGWKRYPDIEAIGAIDRDRINVYGGSLALGHPFAATGGRLLGQAARALSDRGARTALISICAAGALAGAVLLETE